MEMIRLIRLDISGLAFAPECTECPEGTFSSLYGAQHCEPCGENEFSQKGSTKCQQCPPNMWAGKIKIILLKIKYKNYIN